MPGATISRWTMCYFALAIAFLIIGAAMLATGYGDFSALRSPLTLATIHCLAIGWLGLLFVGSLLQFVPVLVAIELQSARLALPALIILVAGLLALMCGFMSLAGSGVQAIYLLPIAASLLVTGIGFVCWMVFVTVLRSGRHPLPAQFVMLGLVSLLVAAGLGATFAYTLAGWPAGEYITTILGSGPSYHAYLGFGGWMTVTAIGVSYRLFAMFMMSPERDGPIMRLTLWAAVCSIVLSAAAALCPSIPVRTGLAVLAFAFVFSALYAADLIRMVRSRRRRELELNSIMGLISVAILPLTLSGLVVAWLCGAISMMTAPAAYLLVMGWLSGLGLAQIYKIVPFLTWMETYGPALGRGPVPRVQDLVDEPKGYAWFGLYIATVLAGAALLAADSPLLFRFVCCLQVISVCAIGTELVRIRSLKYVPAELKHPPGAQAHHLFLPLTNHGRPQ